LFLSYLIIAIRHPVNEYKAESWALLVHCGAHSERERVRSSTMSWVYFSWTPLHRVFLLPQKQQQSCNSNFDGTLWPFPNPIPTCLQDAMTSRVYGYLGETVGLGITKYISRPVQGNTPRN
jgi:hypothetical protein